jgi:hypothetical protein
MNFEFPKSWGELTPQQAEDITLIGTQKEMIAGYSFLILTQQDANVLVCTATLKILKIFDRKMFTNF